MHCSVHVLLQSSLCCSMRNRCCMCRHLHTGNTELHNAMFLLKHLGYGARPAEQPASRRSADAAGCLVRSVDPDELALFIQQTTGSVCKVHITSVHMLTLALIG